MMANDRAKIVFKQVSFYYGSHRVLNRIDAAFDGRAVTAIMGSSGTGKTTLLGLCNRLWDDVPGARLLGSIRLRLGGAWLDVMGDDIAKPMLRRKVAMVFQEPNPLPMSIAKNMAFPLKLAGIRDRQVVAHKTEQALKQAFLWQEVKDRLGKSALELSGGQKQRLCIARALVLEPEVLLCDEPTSSLDEKAAGVIERLLLQLKERCTVLMVSHAGDQVKRIADRMLRLEAGRLCAL